MTVAVEDAEPVMVPVPVVEAEPVALARTETALPVTLPLAVEEYAARAPKIHVSTSS